MSLDIKLLNVPSCVLRSKQKTDALRSFLSAIEPKQQVVFDFFVGFGGVEGGAVCTISGHIFHSYWPHQIRKNTRSSQIRINNLSSSNVHSRTKCFFFLLPIKSKFLKIYLVYKYSYPTP